MTSQWDRLSKNQGTWLGSFTSRTPAGDPLADISSEVSLQPFAAGAAMRQIIRKYPPSAPEEETILEYRSVERGILFGSISRP